jgi:peptidoglycan/xylan/chitin deacetylase (PgdA/CDA1 family)
MDKWILKLIAMLLYYSGLVQLARWWMQESGQHLVILNYHQASGGTLRTHLLYLRRHYRILHLEGALEELSLPCSDGPLRKDRRTALVLTFDDGSRDNYTYAFKLARELQIPITMFLIPGYIESGSRFWWWEGDHLVSHAQVDEVTIEGQVYHLDYGNERRALARVIDAHVRYATSVCEREKFLAFVREALVVPSSAVFLDEQSSLPVTWAEVKEMEESGWVSFGAHTMHHPILEYLSSLEELQFEVCQSRAILEQKLGHRLRTFVYPVGQFEHIGECGYYAVQEAGYDWALTCIDGYNTERSDPYLLRRVVVDVDQHWMMVAAKVSGIWRCFRTACHPFMLLVRMFRR